MKKTDRGSALSTELACLASKTGAAKLRPHDRAAVGCRRSSRAGRDDQQVIHPAQQ